MKILTMLPCPKCKKIIERQTTDQEEDLSGLRHMPSTPLFRHPGGAIVCGHCYAAFSDFLDKLKFIGWLPGHYQWFHKFCKNKVVTAFKARHGKKIAE